LKRTKAKTLPFNEKYKTADLFSFIEDEIDKLKSKKVRWEIDAQQLLDEADALRRRAEEECRLLTKANVIRQASSKKLDDLKNFDANIIVVIGDWRFRAP